MAYPPLIKKIISKTKTNKIPGFKTVSLYDTLKRIKEQVVWDDLVERASAISFNSATALPPMMLFLCTLIPIFAKFNFIAEMNLIGQMEAVIKDIIPARSNYEPVIEFVNGIVNKPRSGLLVISIILSIFFSSNAMMGVMRSFDKNYPGFKKRKGFKKRLTAIRITLVLVMLFILCLALLITQQSVLEWLGITNEFVAGLLGKARWLLILALVFFIISFIYRHAPSVDEKWKIITPGSVMATAMVVVGTLGFSWWVSQFGTYNKLYGSISAIIVILVMIFLNSLILLFGFELNASIYSLTKTKEDKENLKDA